MFKVSIPIYELIIYIATFITVWIISYFKIKICMQLYNNQQCKYLSLRQELSYDLEGKKQDYQDSLEDCKEYRKQTFDTDVKQLHDRADKIISNMISVSDNKQSKYSVDRDKAVAEIKLMIQNILNIK